MSTQTAPKSMLDLDKPSRLRYHTVAGWAILLLLVLSNGPLFLCMPLIDDAELIDVAALTLLCGGVLYRDVFETNLPGAVWFHAAVRGFFGTSSVALRAADLAVFGLLVVFLWDALKAGGLARSWRCWVAVLAFWFYFSISEWCHCQRDEWLLAMALGALAVRRRRVERLRGTPPPNGHVVIGAVLEGFVWGAAVWLKPMVILPAFAAWLASAWLIRRTKPVVFDLLGLLAGGVLAGVAGLTWLWLSGAWPYFWDALLVWNPTYVAAGRKNWSWESFLYMAYRWFPWFLLYVPALVMAVVAVVRGLLARRSQPASRCAEARDPLAASMLLAAFYLGWVVQTVFFQQLSDYVYAPGVLLSLALCAAAVLARPRRTWTAIAVVFLAIAFLRSPVWDAKRLSCWRACIEQGSTPEIRERLKLHPVPAWRELARVAEYLRSKNLSDGEVSCFRNSLVCLYGELGLRPPTRYVYLQGLLGYFPNREEVFRQALAQSAQKYVVTDLVAGGIAFDEVQRFPSGERAFQLAGTVRQTENVYPWSLPIVFRAGRYAVHRVDRPIGRLQNEVPR